MAIILAKKNNQYNVQRRHFYIDDESDFETLESEWDCGIGDLAELPNGTVYCRHSDNYSGDLWEKRSSGKSPSPTPTPTPTSSILYVDFVYDDSTFVTSLDKTASEILEAAPMVVAVRDIPDDEPARYLLVRYGGSGEIPGFVFMFGSGTDGSHNTTFYAQSLSDYPNDVEPSPPT